MGQFYMKNVTERLSKFLSVLSELLGNSLVFLLAGID